MIDINFTCIFPISYNQHLLFIINKKNKYFNYTYRFSVHIEVGFISMKDFFWEYKMLHVERNFYIIYRLRKVQEIQSISRFQCDLNNYLMIIFPDWFPKHFYSLILLQSYERRTVFSLGYYYHIEVYLLECVDSTLTSPRGCFCENPLLFLSQHWGSAWTTEISNCSRVFYSPSFNKKSGFHFHAGVLLCNLGWPFAMAITYYFRSSLYFWFYSFWTRFLAAPDTCSSLINWQLQL